MQPNGGGTAQPSSGQPNAGRGGQPTKWPATNTSQPNNPAGRPITAGASTSTAGSIKVPPGTTTTARPGGGATHIAPDGQKWEVDKKGQLTSYARRNMEARFRENGRLSSAHIIRPDHSELTFHRGFRGERRVELVRADRIRIISYGPRHGYLERPLTSRPGYISRTYVVNGRSYVHVYKTYYYRNITYYHYVPAEYYRPAFYGWAHNPWATPIAYRWGWSGEPWYGYYGSYFEPASAYPTPALWLTDFVMAENLKLAYENRLAAKANADGDAEEPDSLEEGQSHPQAAALSPEVKLAIAEEVKRQLAEEQSASQSITATAVQPAGRSNEQVAPAAIDPNHRIFIVSTSLDVTAANGPCSLTPGDIILRQSDTLVDGSKLQVNVLNSKQGDCPTNTSTEIEATTLQEMHNQFREDIHAGLKTLAENQGKGGIPIGPAAEPRPAAEGEAAPDLNVESLIRTQQEDAKQVEMEIRQASSNQ